jgi:outer membrane biosynthesis protein TonB
MMPREYCLKILFFVFIALVVSLAFAILAQDNPVASAMSAHQPVEQAQVYLPLVNQGASTDNATATPTPTTQPDDEPTATPTATEEPTPPAARHGLFASDEWLTYNADTVVGALGLLP